MLQPKEKMTSCALPRVMTRGGWWEALQEDGLTVTAGMESMERRQMCSFHVFDTVPQIPFQPLQCSRPPIAPPTSLLWS